MFHPHTDVRYSSNIHVLNCIEIRQLDGPPGVPPGQASLTSTSSSSKSSTGVHVDVAVVVVVVEALDAVVEALDAVAAAGGGAAVVYRLRGERLVRPGRQRPEDEGVAAGFEAEVGEGGAGRVGGVTGHI